MTDEEMLIVKLDLLEISQLYVNKIKIINDTKTKANLFDFVMKINKGLQLIDKMEQNIIASNINSSEYKIIALRQNSEIESQKKTIIELVNKLDKYGGI